MAGATCEQLAAVAAPSEVEAAFAILEHLAGDSGRRVGKQQGKSPFDAVYRWQE